MLGDIITKIFGSKHERDIKRISPLIGEINHYYQEYHELSDDELRFKTIEFKNSIQQRVGEIQSRIHDLQEMLRQDLSADEVIDTDNIREEIERLEDEENEASEDILQELLPQAYALAKEACRRLVGKTWSVSDIESTWDMVPFDVQLIGGIVLHEGKIAEMATGEGKTLVATMPLDRKSTRLNSSHDV